MGSLSLSLSIYQQFCLQLKASHLLQILFWTILESESQSNSVEFGSTSPQRELKRVKIAPPQIITLSGMETVSIKPTIWVGGGLTLILFLSSTEKRSNGNSQFGGRGEVLVWDTTAFHTFCTAGWTKQREWRCHLGLWETGILHTKHLTDEPNVCNVNSSW